MHSGRVSRIALGGLLACLTLQFSASLARAQGRFDDDRPSRAPARRSNDDLLRSLIESEMERRELRGTTPRGSLPVPSSVRDQPTREMLQARQLLTNISQDANNLAADLNDEMRVNPAVRALMTDVLKLRARVAIIAQRAQQQNDHLLLTEDLRNLDRDWRTVAMRLAQIRDLDRRVQNSIDHINDHAKELAAILNIAPQLNSRELMRYTSTIVTDLGNLLEDIDIELARSNERNQLIAAGRRVRQEAYLLSNAVDDNRPYNFILDEYKQLQGLWAPFAASLRPFQNRVLDRHVRRIAEAMSNVQELLWLPSKIDRQQVLYLTDSLKRDVDEFFARTPLKLLIDLPDTRLVLPTAHEFYGVCSHFTDSVNNDQDEQEVVDAFRYIESAHRDFSNVFRNVNSQAALQVLRQIDQDVLALRDAMRIQAPGTGSGRRAADIAALIDNLGAQLEVDTKRWLDKDRVSFRQQALQEVGSFATQARRLNESINYSNNPIQQQRDVSLLFESWKRVYGYISKCDTQDRPRLQNLSVQITPALVELQTLIAP